MTDEPHDPFADVPSDPLADEEPAEAPPEEAAIEPTTDESLGGFDLPDPATEPEPEEVPTPVESSETDPEIEKAVEAEEIAFEESGSEYDPEPAASEPIGPEDVPEADGSVTAADAPVEPEPEPEPVAIPDPEPPAASNGAANNKRTYLCLEEVEVKGSKKKGWVQVAEVEARNGDTALRLAYRDISEERGSYYEARLVVVAARMFQPKTIQTRERRQAPAIQVS